ncbi:hypothetical protein K469DRAFT_792142 [Zopfia rhizophila CBS 207.26]|uniref:Uncharacterized protein n=1 Tax=Zopfia rhizophila CBS 207.26 TaxID=1314779 RepID=A0A6A6DRF3_9PEZI|nr:hypothetical protein K469DRAFT_792142 [Zopfia rhizophila CBS 207.26]
MSAGPDNSESNPRKPRKVYGFHDSHADTSVHYSPDNPAKYPTPYNPAGGSQHASPCTYSSTPDQSYFSPPQYTDPTISFSTPALMNSPDPPITPYHLDPYGMMGHYKQRDTTIMYAPPNLRSTPNIGRPVGHVRSGSFLNPHAATFTPGRPMIPLPENAP